MQDFLTYDNAIAYREFELENDPNEKVQVFIGKPFWQITRQKNGLALIALLEQGKI